MAPGAAGGGTDPTWGTGGSQRRVAAPGHLRLRVSQPSHLGARGSGRMREALWGPSGTRPAGPAGLVSNSEVPSQFRATTTVSKFYHQTRAA